ncbi:hypothetical protein ACIQMR_37800 [Streptomyces sp. NPDC091376]|uniref:hypothetical protein n=1 Tax=Streptomyces sp. NPDC091376 TaxID=3365994 RepID=UPI0038073872
MPASLRASALPTGDLDTSEIRSPLDLNSPDHATGRVDQVLSRLEPERLHAALTYQMSRTDSSSLRLTLEAV